MTAHFQRIGAGDAAADAYGRSGTLRWRRFEGCEARQHAVITALHARHDRGSAREEKGAVRGSPRLLTCRNSRGSPNITSHGFEVPRSKTNLEEEMLNWYARSTDLESAASVHMQVSCSCSPDKKTVEIEAFFPSINVSYDSPKAWFSVISFDGWRVSKTALAITHSSRS